VSDERIYRRTEHLEEVKVPDGHIVCRRCKGKGSLTKYDQGWSSPVYMAHLDAPETCYRCQGLGYEAVGVLPEGEKP
jgi:DnaJ-class molecular chaperone